MTLFNARVTVTLKNGVLDPQGKAIEGSLSALGVAGVGAVRQGKIFDIDLEESSKKAALERLNSMCEQLLANTVIEDYSVEIVV
jgi:phosphoribosylformylglycinamidine synthase PurS subunit